jgi:hypothetical protein|tara:strand:- start:811 stop:1005 length:195 start_codon:yes stop_codon:yes gene_type:complete
MFTKDFWSYSSERALKTFAQTAIAYLGTSEVLGLFSVDYTALFSLAGGAALLSVLTSIVSKPKA